ncbi:excinuclease ABC subunit B [Candidatus Cerribacteria bacterium 'Amazon FNV 2010 28 9']|uniref:UvrABC system protein B n=1 Tax=Candidatus Cerribacteria bacterium 'Amazon FNV 2010 28 9' TaxID=2081795 RepID=A0A317JRQ3_9BACT|nr:MAG: excinuclease ABC subunit B [Candidatus Cerribacteria bacterium 'Amazon FNV 2010 28 9']
MAFELVSPFGPTGDQPSCINTLVSGVQENKQHQVLLGVTGSGKTFSVANVIAKTQKPTLIIAHNKTLAGQLYQEFRDFFPNNAVSYFVSYYDYYQPEAYIPSTDTYIEKETEINDEIDKLRLATTTNLLTRPDCIVIASVSCIYNLGSPVEYGKYVLELVEGELISRQSVLGQLVNLQYDRNDTDLHRGSFRVRGESIQIWPAYEDTALTITMLGNQIERIKRIDPVSGDEIEEQQSREPWDPSKGQQGVSPRRYILYPAKHYMTNPTTQEQAIAQIESDLQERLHVLKASGKTLEAYRLEQKVHYDMDMIKELGSVNGIENYSRYFDGRKPGDPPFTLLDYFHHNAKQFGDGKFLTVIDESHITIPQIRGMYNGDQARKQVLIEYGFRLPSALDNRPLQFEEFLRNIEDTIYVSATPSPWEISMSNHEVAEQLIRPTGLIEPEIDIRPSQGQVEDLMKEIIIRKQKNQRVLVTTLTKRMAEALTEYLNDEKKMTRAASRVIPEPGVQRQVSGSQSILPKVAYLHSDIETLDRSDILSDLRLGNYDVLVGINLLREGLDLPEVTLVALLDADKEGFLRSSSSLVQIMGRAARHNEGHVIMYADRITGSMQQAIDEVNRRRTIQIQYNNEHHITPTNIVKPVREQMIKRVPKDEQPKVAPSKLRVTVNKNTTIDLQTIDPENMLPNDKQKMIKQLKRVMTQAAKDWNFELAAEIRDAIAKLE